MNHVTGLINLHEDNDLIKEVTKIRPIATIPFAGRYRIIDFILSSMVNSGIVSVGIILPNKSASVLDHLRSGKDWDLARRHEGLYYMTPLDTNSRTHPSELRTLYQNLDAMHRNVYDYVLLSGSRSVFNMDFNNALRFHQNTKADITMLYYKNSQKKFSPCTVLQTQETGLVTDIANQPVADDNASVFMDIYLMSQKIFMDIVKYTYERGGSDFLLDGIMRTQKKYNIYGYCHNGYVSIVNSTLNYYHTSMDLLNPQIWHELFLNKFPIYTRIKDDVPARYKADAHVSNSLISNGCVLKGQVENSILFRNVKVDAGARIKNSIIMQGCRIKENAFIENVICDKNVMVDVKKVLKGADDYPFIIEKNTVI